MKSIITHTGILTNVQRYDTSRNGNPRYTAEVDGCTFFTGVDSSHGYSITNFRGDEVIVTLQMHRGKLTLQSIKNSSK